MATGVLFVTAIFVLVGTIWRPPAMVIRYFQRRWPDTLWEINTQMRVVALTIDDGPSKYTEEILGVLRDNTTTATFFVIGSRMGGKEEVLRQMLVHGNELGNHAVYDEPSWRLSKEELCSQIRMVDQQINTVYESVDLTRSGKYFRPGSGFFNSKMCAVVVKLGYRLVLGGIYPHDAQIPSAALNAWHIGSLIRPGSIIVCHDGRSWTAPMLRAALPRIRARGYKVVSLSTLLEYGKQAEADIISTIDRTQHLLNEC